MEVSPLDDAIPQSTSFGMNFRMGKAGQLEFAAKKKVIDSIKKQNYAAVAAERVKKDEMKGTTGPRREHRNIFGKK